VLRYPVAHQHAMTGCYGYLYVSRDSMRYEVVQPEKDKGHSFERPRSQLTVAKQWTFMGKGLPEAEFKFAGGGTYHFFHIRKELVQSGGKLDWGSVLAYQDLISAVNDFETIVAGLEMQAERLRPPPPAPPPVISMLEPEGAEEGRTVAGSGSALHVRGVASQATGIVSVSVNGQTAYLKNLAPQTVEFDLREVPLPAGLNAVVVVATAQDKSQGQLLFKVSKAEVRVLEPAAGSETAEGRVKVRGLVVGMRDIDRVEVAGQRAVLRTLNDGNVEFEAEQVALAEGANTLAGVVSTVSGRRETFKVEVKRVPPAGPPPLTSAEVEEALAGGIPVGRVTEMVSQYGVNFALTDEIEGRLRALGADDALLLAIAKAKR